MTPEVPFWDTVVVNMAPIIIALTGFGAMLGGFYMQYRMMKQQNQKIDQNADIASTARLNITSKIDKVAEATNGIIEKNVAMARDLGVAEGVKQERERNNAP